MPRRQKNLTPSTDRTIPTKYVGMLEPNWHCRAWNAKREKYCASRAGMGTDHPGVGRCKLHGGAQPILSGRYSRLQRTQLRELIERHEADPDPMNILPELAAARALFEDFVNRYELFAAALLAWHDSWERGTEADGDAPKKPRRILDIADAHRLIAQITKIVERIERIRAADAMSRADLYRIMGEMARVVDTYVDDGEAIQKIKDAWLSIRV